MLGGYVKRSCGGGLMMSIDSGMHCFFISTIFDIYAFNGFHLARRYTRRYVQARDKSEAQDIFSYFFAQDMARSLHLSIDDIELLTHRPILVIKVETGKCIRYQQENHKEMDKNSE
jgi:hypothetical protein